MSHLRRVIGLVFSVVVASAVLAAPAAAVTTGAAQTNVTVKVPQTARERCC